MNDHEIGMQSQPVHLGQLLKDKLMDNSNDNVLKDIINNQANNITQLTAELNAAKARVDDLQDLFAQSQTKARLLNEEVERQRELKQEWHTHCNKVSAIHDAVKEVVDNIIYGDCFKEHIEHIAQERIDVTLQHDVGIDYDKLNDNLDYDKLANKIDLGELACNHIDVGDLSDQIASAIYMPDVASEIDLKELAGEIDLSDLADEMSCSDIASELAQRVKVDVNFNY